MPTRAEPLPIELDRDFLTSVASRVGGSFYVFDESRFERNFLDFREGLRKYYSRSEVAYALKANYMPAIGSILDRVDGMGEVVSRFEYEVAALSLPTERLIFNGPVKRRDDLRRALSAGSMVNLDSFREIRTLEEIAGEYRAIDIGLRVSFPLASGPTRFGFKSEDGELEVALGALSRMSNVNIKGLHCHFSTRDKTVQGYVERVRNLCRLARSLPRNYDCDTINVGGGFFGRMPEYLRNQFSIPIPSLEEYAEAIGKQFAAEFADHSHVLIAEPGVSMVADTICLAAEVVDVRRRGQGYQAVLDTSINSVNPTRSALRAPMHSVTRVGEPLGAEREYRLVGNTCMEHDIIADGFKGQLDEGDFMIFENRGAYSINYTPPFIVPAPAIVDRRGRILKRADDCTSVLSTYVSGTNAAASKRW